MIILACLPVLNKMTTYEYIVRKRDEEECRSSQKDLKQDVPTSKPIKVQLSLMYLPVLECNYCMLHVV